MPDTPLWTLQLTDMEPQLVLRGLLSVIPGMVGGDGREFFRQAVKELQGGAVSLTGHWMELLSVTDSVMQHFNDEAASIRTREASENADTAYKLIGKVQALKSQKPTGTRAAKKPVEKPKPKKQADLFGDD